MNGPSSTALETVGRVVAALGDSYAGALDCYAGWRRRQRAHNHYQAPTRGTSNSDGGDDNNAKSGETTTTTSTFSAAGASLRLSKLRIEEAFRSGVDVLGDEFVSGDAACRDALLEKLARLRDCVAALERAIEAEDHQPLPLAEVVRVSEAVRVASLAALHKQYQRLVVGRLAPRGSSLASAPTLLMTSDNGHHAEEVGHEAGPDDAAAQTHQHQTTLEKISPNNDSNSNNNSNHEPPSPPPTPTRGSKELPDGDFESMYSWSTAGFDARPKNSVFSVFCPEAMKYQVDLEKALPIKGARCRCGYVWNTSCCAEDRTAMVIKDGFQITPRFLGKSHCDKGLGCVLCTSSGKTETFGSVEGLKTHINSAHTKWQLLHDRDLAGH
ncbi:hypothetical protein F5Y12DRAFT_606424 [Xylaria sp. FL1777]|nr:hypothetical protein F5Y12DRAFT_606424 [Xylaria sp. FL1777]